MTIKLSSDLLSEALPFNVVVKAHLSRLLSQFSDKMLAVATAFRFENTGEENIHLQDELNARLTQNGIGACGLVGH